MNKNRTHPDHLALQHRLLHLLLCLLAIILMGLVLVYGLIMTTNILTQLNHSETWFYVAAFVACYLVIAFGIGWLYKIMVKHFKLLKSGVRPTESP